MAVPRIILVVPLFLIRILLSSEPLMMEPILDQHICSFELELHGHSSKSFLLQMQHVTISAVRLLLMMTPLLSVQSVAIITEMNLVPRISSPGQVLRGHSKPDSSPQIVQKESILVILFLLMAILL
jgi:hypothetical protein